MTVPQTPAATDHRGADDPGELPGGVADQQPATTAPAASGASEQAREVTQLAAQAASDKLAKDIVAFDVSQHLAITDVFLIASAPSERQVGAIVDGIEERLLAAGLRPTRREGDRENRWVLLDYLDVVVHVQHDEERALYSLERLWRDCPRLELDLAEPPADAVRAESDAGAGTGTARW